MTYTRITLGIFALTNLWTVPAIAETTTSALMEEVVVTAQRREQNLQDTPVSITAFSGEAIEALGFRQSTDITAQTPNFSVGYPTGDTGVPAPFIRGVGLNDFNVLNQGPIAAYVDQTYIASGAAQIFQLLDIERVEVLRGPQGTLYGRNATGGAVNYIAKKPTQEWEGSFRAGAGSWGLRKYEGAFGGPVSETVGVRISALKTDSDGWLKNQLTGNDQQGIDEFAWRALVDWTPNDQLNLLLNVRGGNTKSDSVQYRHLGVWEADGSGAMCSNVDIRAGRCVDIFGYSEASPYTNFNGEDSPATPDHDEGNYNLEAENDSEFWGVSLTAEWQVGEYTLASITSFDHMDDFRPEDADAGPNDILESEYQIEQDTFGQELRINWQGESWSWMAGAYYLKDEAEDATGFDLLRDARVFNIGDDVNCSAPAGNPTGFCPEGFVYLSRSGTDQDIESFAVFFDTTLDLSDSTKLSAGLRYTDEEVEHDSFFFYDEPIANNPSFPGFPSNQSNDFSNVSGRLVLDHALSEDVLLYGGITTGFKAGGIQSTADGVAFYDEEELISYEAGFKTTWQDGRVRFNGAAFYYDYTDLQVFAFVIENGIGFQRITNAADANICGAELELQWLPTDNLFINLGLGILETEYEDFLIEGVDYSGNTIPMSPDMTINGLVQYDIPLGERGTLTLQTDFNYQDEVSFDAFNNPLLSEEDYWIWNARVSWTSRDDRWEVAAYGRNLNDEEFIVYGFDISFFGFNEEMLGTPRSYGVDVTFRF